MDIQSIVSAQKQYFFTGKTKSYEHRHDNLEKLERVIQNNQERIVVALKDDLNKPEFEVYTSEVGFLLDEIKFTKRNLRRWMSPKKVSTPLVLKPASAAIYNDPYGVVAVLAPWNYPFQLALAPVVGAIAAGNTCILKPAELTPSTQKIICELINKNFEPHFLYAIDGGVQEAEELLDQKLDFIFYTGSTRVGKIIMKKAAENLTPICLELGGKSPSIVTRNANIEIAAKRIAWGKCFNAGQTCVAPDYTFVDKNIKAQFIEKLTQYLLEFYTKESFPKIVSEQHTKRIADLAGIEVDVSKRSISPMAIDLQSIDHPLMEEEIFGPILPIIGYDNLDQVLIYINEKPKPLALYVFSEEQSEQEKVLTSTSSGSACINDCLVHLSNPLLPFGGVGESGMGAYHGHHSFETFTHQKGVHKGKSILDNPLRYPPYTEKQLHWIKKFL